MKPPSSQALSVFRNYNPFHNIIHYYVDLSCFLLSPTPPRDWWALNRRKRVTNLFSLEVKYRSIAVRDIFLERCFKEMESTQKTVCGERLGFKDLFVPIVKDGKIISSLQAGAFRESEITKEVLENCWKELSGSKPSAVLPEFREFVRVLLDIPVLDGPLFAAFQESLELFAELLSSSEGDPPESIGQRLRWLLLNVFSKGLPHSYWLDWALGRPTSESVPAWGNRMEEWGWVRDEIGISQTPTTVITVIPQRPGNPQLDWTAEMIRIYRFQRKSFRFGQSLPQTVSGKLDDYGAVFVTSAEPRLPRLAQKRFIESIVRRIHDFSRKELGVPVLVGLGETVSPGDPLNDSYRQAVMALHLRRDSEKNIIYFGEKGKQKTNGGFGELRQILEELDRSFGTSTFPGLEALSEEFVKQAIHLSLNNPQEIRWHFLYALDRLSETAGNRMDLGKKEAGQLRMEISKQMEQAATLQDLVLEFKEALRLLAQRIEKPRLFQEAYSIQKIRDHLDKHFRKPVQVNRLAEMAGVSASTLSRRFQKAIGIGLEVYLQNRRIVEAKRLLGTTSLSVARIARDCGFKTGSPFTRFFRKKTGFSPQSFRKKSLGS